MKLTTDSVIFRDLSAFFSTPSRPLLIEELNVMTAHEVKDLLLAVRAVTK